MKLALKIGLLMSLLLSQRLVFAQDCPRLCQAMQVAGDMIINNTRAQAARLPIGTLGQVLSVNASGIPEWSNTIVSPIISGDLTIYEGGDTQRPITFTSLSDTVLIQRYGDSGVTANQKFFLVPGTSAGDNDTEIYIAASSTATYSDGALIRVAGNELATGGYITLGGGTVATGHVNIQTNHASARVNFYNSAGSATWYLSDAGVWNQNGSSGSNIVFNKDNTGIFAGTSDAADNIDLVIAGGGAATASRGGTILIAGNEGSGAGAVQLYGGNTATANINFVINNASAKIQLFNASTVLKWSMDNNGLLTTPTSFGNDIGWTPVNAANQACNTTCATGCVFGMNTGALGNFVGCADATADTCICAGAS